MRVINPPGGKCNINLFEEEAEPPTLPMNKCQKERMKSQVFDNTANIKQEVSKPEENASEEHKEKEVASPKSPKNGIESSIFPCASWYPEKLQQKRQSPFAIRNNQSNIF